MSGNVGLGNRCLQPIPKEKKKETENQLKDKKKTPQNIFNNSPSLLNEDEASTAVPAVSTLDKTGTVKA